MRRPGHQEKRIDLSVIKEVQVTGLGTMNTEKNKYNDLLKLACNRRKDI